MASAHGHGSQLQSKYAFLARPRRFGKTLLVATLEAFFQGDLPRSGSSDKVSFDPDAGERVELFNGTAVEDLVRQTRAHPVVRLNLAMATSDTPERLHTRLLAHLESVYTDCTAVVWQPALNLGPKEVSSGFRHHPRIPIRCLPPGAWKTCCMKLERQFKAKPVVLIDEYDAPLTHLLGRDMDPEPFIAVLREFFGLLKHLENHLHFVFITDISRFAHVNLFLVLNNLKDISWDSDYADLCGFSEADLKDLLLPYLQAGAVNLGEPVEDVTQELRDHYNGYCFGVPGFDDNVYNPYSLLNRRDDRQVAAAARWKLFGWSNDRSESGMPRFLVRMARNGDLAWPRSRLRSIS